MGQGPELAGGDARPTSVGMNRLPAFASRSLLSMARRFMDTEPSQVLGPDGDPYLRRWWLEKDRSTGSVYIHQMLRSDRDEEFHDHPSANLSIVLEGEMIEHTPEGITRWRAGDIVARRPEDRHRIEIEAPLITMWIMGPKVREWGFWRETEQGEEFVHSQDFFRERGYF